MNGHYISMGIIAVIVIVLIIWFVKNLLWIGIGMVLGYVLCLNISKAKPYLAEAKRRL